MVHPLRAHPCHLLPQGKRVLELGCGCGLVGLVFASLGADVLLTDLPDTMVSGLAPHYFRTAFVVQRAN